MGVGGLATSDPIQLNTLRQVVAVEAESRKWLTWYFEHFAAVGDKVPENIQLFLPWNLSEEKKETVASLLGSLIPRPVIGPGE